MIITTLKDIKESSEKTTKKIKNQILQIYQIRILSSIYIKAVFWKDVFLMIFIKQIKIMQKDK